MLVYKWMLGSKVSLARRCATEREIERERLGRAANPDMSEVPPVFQTGGILVSPAPFPFGRSVEALLACLLACFVLALL